MKGTRRENDHTLKAAVNDRKSQTKFSPITATALREKMSAGGMHHLRTSLSQLINVRLTRTRHHPDSSL